MLPNRFSLTESSEEKLKREKIKTGISPNLIARELFFLSIEKKRTQKIANSGSFKFGSMLLDKAVWLGESQTATELILEHLYPGKTPDEYAKLWALHVASEL